MQKHIVTVRELLIERPNFDQQALKLWLALHLDTHSVIRLCAERLKHGATPTHTYLQLLTQCINARSDY